MEIIYQDNRILVCLKPFGVVSTDEPGGLPDLVRQALGAGRSVCARFIAWIRLWAALWCWPAPGRRRGSCLSRWRLANLKRNIWRFWRACRNMTRANCVTCWAGTRQKKLTYVAGAPGKDVREAVLRYRLLDSRDGFSLVKIHLLTGRTHQIRCQFSSRGLPLAGDCKYGARCREMEGIGLWSHWIAFRHPQTDAPVSFQAPPPRTWPWTLFPALWTEEESLKQIAIIGGGASGLAAALSAARTDPKAEITVLEGLDRVGKKILATGNGRCNLTNSDLANAHYHSSQPELLGNLLAEMPTERTLDFFHSLGLWCAEEELGRIYPNARQASAVLDVLLNGLEHSGVRVECGVKVKNAARTERGFRLTAEDGRAFLADAVVLAAGGRAAPKQGTDGTGFALCPAAGPQLSPALSVPCAAEMRGAGFEGPKGGPCPRYRCADPGRHGARKGKRRDTVHRLRPVRHSDFSALLPAGTGERRGGTDGGSAAGSDAGGTDAGAAPSGEAEPRGCTGAVPCPD